MNVLWYTYADGIRLGPMSWDEVRAAARDGSLKPDHYVWTAGYGAEWRKASTLESLFPPADAKEKEPAVPPPPGPGERASAPADEPPGAAAAFAEKLRAGLRAERSPFEPPPGSPDASARRPVSCLGALGTAWFNMRVVLFAPFAFRRWLLFSVAAFLVVVGSQSELVVAPAAVGTATAADAASGRSGSKLAAFAARWQDGSAALDAAGDPDAVWRELGEALRADSAAASDWAGRAFASNWSLFVFVALLLFYAAIRSWFLSRAWSLLLDRVYRRDDPAFVVWADSARPSRELFRAVFVLRVLFAAVCGFAACVAVSYFNALPAGEPVPAGAASATAGVFSLLLLLDAAAMALLRDCLAPRMLLLRTSFAGAFAALRREAGWWLVRYFGALAVYSVLYGLALAALAGLLAALVAALGLPMLATFLLAALVMPLQLWRTLWSLDLLFRLRPDLRAALPPRRAEEFLRRMQGGAEPPR